MTKVNKIIKEIKEKKEMNRKLIVKALIFNLIREEKDKDLKSYIQNLRKIFIETFFSNFDFKTLSKERLKVLEEAFEKALDKTLEVTLKDLIPLI